MAGRAIFRESAMAAYRRGSNRDTVPRVTSWPVLAGAWFILGALLAGAFFAWSVRVPIYVAATGVILGDSVDGRRTAAALFLPLDQSSRLGVGQPVHAQIGSSGMYVNGAIETIEPEAIGPDAARTRFHLDAGSGLVTEPSKVAVVRLDATLPPAVYGGSRLSAEVEVGSQRLLTLLSGPDGNLGEN